MELIWSTDSSSEDRRMERTNSLPLSGTFPPGSWDEVFTQKPACEAMISPWNNAWLKTCETASLKCQVKINK